MEPFELLRQLVEKLDQLQLKYLVTGSIATIVYGEPRFTNDIDVIIDLQLDQLSSFADAFPAPEFYLSHEAIREAIRNHGQFNLIHPQSGLKVDFIVPAKSDFESSRQSRVRKVELPGRFEAPFASAEDVILRKMEYYRLAARTSICETSQTCSKYKDHVSIGITSIRGPSV